MAIPAYSTRFFDVAHASDSIYTYTVGDGLRAVIRELAVGVGVALLGQGITLYLPSGGRVVYLGSSEATPTFESFYWTGRIVVNAGESFAIGVTGGPIDFYAGGYLLSATG